METTRGSTALRVQTKESFGATDTKRLCVINVNQLDVGIIDTAVLALHTNDAASRAPKHNASLGNTLRTGIQIMYRTFRFSAKARREEEAEGE